MYPDLNSFVEQSSPPVPEFVLIKDYAPTCEGSLLIHHFISLYLQANCQVCFLACEEGFQHYSNVARKLSVQLQEHIDSGKLVFIDGFSRPYALSESTDLKLIKSGMALASQQGVSEDAMGSSVQASDSQDRFSIGHDEDFSAAVLRFYEKILAAIHSFEERFKDSQSCIIIDSMATFLNSSRCTPRDGDQHFQTLLR